MRTHGARRIGGGPGRRAGRLTMVAIAGTALAAGGPSGCGVDRGLLAMRDEAARTHAAIEADREGLLAAAAEADASGNGPARQRLEGLAAQRAAQAEAYERTLAQLDGLIASAQADPAGSIEAGASAVSGLLPEPMRLPLLLGAGLAASVWRAAALKKSAVSIARGLQKAMDGDEALADGVRRNADTLRSVQTRTARRIVDEATKPSPMVRLPV